MVAPRMGVKNILVNWPEEAREIAQKIIDKYGEPEEASVSRLIWRKNGPWKRTEIYRDLVRHDFPFPHLDGVEQIVNYLVPWEKCCELVAFNGSLTVYRTRGEIAACCQNEAMNFLILNLAHDIIREACSFEEARRYFLEYLLAYQRRGEVPYMQALQFIPESETADADISATSAEELDKMGISQSG